MRLLPGRRALLYAALFLSILVAGAFFGGRALLRSAIEERLVGAAASRGVALSWSELELTLGGRITFRDVRFESENGGRFEGTLDSVTTRVPLDAVLGDAGLGEVALRGLTVRADPLGITALRDAAATDTTADEAASAPPDSPSRLRGAVLRLEDADLLLELGDDAPGVRADAPPDDRPYVGCHLDELTVERVDGLAASVRGECRVPYLGLESGPVQVTARRAPRAPDEVLATEPWELVVTPETSVRVAEGGIALGRLAATVGPTSAHLEVSGLRLTPDRLAGGPAKLIPEVGVDSLGVVLRREGGDWLVERLDAGPGRLTLRLPFEVAPPADPDAEATDPDAADPDTEDEERLGLDEMPSVEDVVQPSVQWEALETGVRRAELALTQGMDLLTSLAERVDVRDIAVAIEAGPAGAPPTATIPATLETFTAESGRATLTTRFADHDIQFEVSRPADDPDGPLRLVMQVASLDVGRVSATLGHPGLFAGHLDLDLTVQAGDSLRLALEVATPDLVFTHAAVSPEPVALLPVALSTSVAFSTEGDERLRIETTGSMGEHVRGRTTVVVTHDSAESRNDLVATFGIEEADCADLLGAIPAGLFVYMDRDEIRMRGRAAVDGTIEYELGRPRSFELTFGDTFPGTCRFSRLPRGFRPEVLNEDTYTHRVSEEYATTRVVVGPGTEGYRRLEELPAYVPAVMYLTEHINFYDEPAISLGLLNKAIRINLVHGRWVYGGSTITQQLVKNLFFDRARHLARKLEEAIIAWAVEEVVSKDRILELYLNCIEFGPDIYGIEAAAQYYFNVTAPELTPLQAAYLAGLKYAPRHGGRYRDRGWSPRRERWQGRLRENLRRLRARGFIEQSYIDSIDSWIIPLGENARPGADIVPLD
jgi:hypothetical protein